MGVSRTLDFEEGEVNLLIGDFAFRGIGEVVDADVEQPRPATDGNEDQVIRSCQKIT
jgi:hypothetical protein